MRRGRFHPLPTGPRPDGQHRPPTPTASPRTPVTSPTEPKNRFFSGLPGLYSPSVAGHDGLVDGFASEVAEVQTSATRQVAGVLLLLLQLTLALPAGFTRGRAVKREGKDQFYSCEKYAECRDDPVEATAYNPHIPEYCETHNLPMKTLVEKCNH